MNKYQLFSEHKNCELYGASAADALTRAGAIPQADKYIPPEESGKYYGDKPICAYEPRPDITINAILGEEDVSSSRRGDKQYQRIICDTSEGVRPIDIVCADAVITAYMADIGRKGGEATTPAKQTASRANGKLGGRPKTKKSGKK